MIYIGIDPGKSGGVAIIGDDRRVLAHYKMPSTDRDLVDVFELCQVHEPGDAVAVLEKVHASPQMGVVSAFTFGRGYGALRVALAAARIPYDEVTPQRWQKVLGCLSQGDKNVTKARAQQLFPRQTVTHAIADALLLAEFCRRSHLTVERTHVEKENLQTESQGQGRTLRRRTATAAAKAAAAHR